MKPGSKQWKNFMAKLYGWGAAIVIIGALFKIQHWEGASLMLILGLGTEAIIFFMSAFEASRRTRLVLGLPSARHRRRCGQNPTQQLDDMLSKANIDSNMITKLGDGMRHLGEQASKMGEVADASVAAKATVIRW